ncbi:MAG: hypothetical protein CVV58_03720 [Tenericutes bacterium HGW-Tenericutes-3]|nr:MAG: hypothetical protein CVV58_03720 [Tenericutes bacterium HGW-Tenericutes-3]
MELVGNSLDYNNLRYTIEVDNYIKQFSEDIQVILNEVRHIVLSAHPKINETFKYQMPTYVLNKNIFHFAANKNHLGIYPTPQPIEHFKKDIAKYKSSKGAIQFPYNQEIPYDLIRMIVSYQVNTKLKEEKV